MEKAATPQATSACKPLTTFVHTDTNSFREVVQRLTGPTEPNNKAQQDPIPSATKKMGLKKPKLHERRQCMRPKLEIVKPTLSFRPNDQTSPSSKSLKTSPLLTPSSIMSKLTLQEEGHKRGESMALTLEEALMNLSSQEEEKAIKDRRFYLHPSPRERKGYTEPELLTLFPLESPKNN